MIRNNLQRTERLLQLEQKLDFCLAGKERPANPQEGVELAFRAAKRQRYHTAVRFCSEAFKEDPKVGDNRQTQPRYNAACWAALIAEGRDAGGITDKERAELRQQALDWLRTDLEAYSGLPGKDSKDRTMIGRRLAHWQKDNDLAGLRGKDAIDKLPEAEREPWHKLWADVAAVLQRTQQK
jgi:hypothetical protein